jgi:hypothetical protein
MDDKTQQHVGCDVQIALLKQRVDLIERDVKDLDSEIKSLRTEIKASFEKVFERFDAMRDELASAKSFGKGVYWVLGIVAAAVIVFKDEIINLFKG